MLFTLTLQRCVNNITRCFSLCPACSSEFNLYLIVYVKKHCLLLQENYRMGGTFKWPDLEEVVEYRRKVKEVVLSVIDNTPLQLPVTQESPWVSG